MAETTAPKKRGRPKGSGNKSVMLPEERYMKRNDQEYGATEEYKPGDNSRVIRHFMTLRKLPEIDIDDAKAVDDRVWEYMEQCEADDVKPTVEGLAIALHTTRNALCNWQNGVYRKDSGHRDTIKSAVQMINGITAVNLYEGKTNPAAGIFLLKNNAGYTDVQQLTVEAKQQEFEERKMSDVLEEYDDIPEAE